MCIWFSTLWSSCTSILMTANGCFQENHTFIQIKCKYDMPPSPCCKIRKRSYATILFAVEIYEFWLNSGCFECARRRCEISEYENIAPGCHCAARTGAYNSITKVWRISLTISYFAMEQQRTLNAITSVRSCGTRCTGPLGCSPPPPLSRKKQQQRKWDRSLSVCVLEMNWV